MLKSFETINGTLFFFSASAIAKHYATIQLVHSSHFIVWFDQELICVDICFAQQSFSFVCMILLVSKALLLFSGIVGDIIYRAALHSIVLKTFSILTTSIYLLFAVLCLCYVFYSIWL